MKKSFTYTLSSVEIDRMLIEFVPEIGVKQAIVKVTMESDCLIVSTRDTSGSPYRTPKTTVAAENAGTPLSDNKFENPSENY